MAPRAPEPLAAFSARLQRQLAAGATEVRFGAPHFTHAVCLEGGRYLVRRLELDARAVETFRQTHQAFMPEDAEEISTPGAILFAVDTLEALLAGLRAGPFAGLP